MLKQRIITALVIAPLALALIFLSTAEVFRSAVSLLWLLASLEYARLSALGRFATILLILVQAAIFMLLFNFWDRLAGLWVPMLTAACLTWCLMLLRLVTYQPDRPRPFGYAILGFACAIASMTSAWIALAVMFDLPNGEFWILALLLLVWAADIGAYFSGRHFGGRKLSPSISPSKTWAGFWGGLAASVFVTIIFTQAVPGLDRGILSMAVLAAVTMLVSVGGDLFISLQKRTMGLKDTGSLLPGHGGLLDRFDSLVAGAPFFALGLVLTTR